MYGDFGDEQGARVVALDELTELDRNNPQAPRELKARFFPPVIFWNGRGINLDLSNQAPGEYFVSVYCSDPGENDANRSNIKRLEIKKKREQESPITFHDVAVRFFFGGWNPEDILPGEQNSDVSNIADALSEDFTEGIEFYADRILLQVEVTPTGVKTHCRYTNQQINTTVHELRQDGQIIRSSRNFHGLLIPTRDGDFWRSSFEFETVAPGVYDYQCTIGDDQGQEASLATGFIVSGR